MLLKTIPRPPKHIKDEKFMYDLYKEICKDLKERKQLYKVTLPTVHSYVLAYWNYHTIEQKILNPTEKRFALLYTDHNKQLRQHPATRIAKGYFEQVAKLSGMLGIDPYSRSRTKQLKVEDAKVKSLIGLGKAL